MKYHELPYERLDLDKSKKLVSNIVDRFSKSNNGSEQIDIILEMDKFSREYSTYESMASLNFSRDINDENAKNEKEFYDSISPEMTESMDSFDRALSKSDFKSEITKRFGKTYLKQIDLRLKTFDPKIKNMIKEEIDLKNEYTKLTAGAQIKFEGKNYNLSGLGPFHSDKNRKIRKTL